jgi:uncharacterized protein (DUF885 family)
MLEMNTSVSRREMVAGLVAALAVGRARAAFPATTVGADAARGTTSPGNAALSLLDDLAWQLLELDPGKATELGVDMGEHAALRSRLDDRSAAGVDKQRAVLVEGLKRVRALSGAQVDVATRTSLEVVESAFGTALAGMALPYGVATIGSWRNTPYMITQNVGGYLDVPQMLDGDQPVRNAADADAYLARLDAMGALLDGELERARAARAVGLIPPDFLLDKTITALGTSIADAARPNGSLVGPLARKSKEASLPGDFTSRATAIVTKKVIPALERQLAEIKAERKLAKGDAGVGARPHGAEWYAWGLRASTTTSRKPEEIHEMGVSQLAELHVRMDKILAGFGLTKGSVGARASELQRRPEFNFPANDAGRAQIVAYMQSKIDAIRPKLPQAFRRLTRGKLEIHRLPLAAEPGAPAAYGGPGTIDGTVPGKVWVNLGDTKIHNKVTIPDLVFHEGIPGHVWQGEYAQQLPLIRSILAFNAYSEGWALYAEQLADELGMYDGDQAGKLGFLMGLSWRAVRLVIDTGVHAMGWTRDRALTEFIEATGLPHSNAVSEVERYCAWPGQACGYKVGQTEILLQRSRAQNSLGRKFDLRDFDQAVVEGGNVPLDVLSANVWRYIKSNS